MISLTERGPPSGAAPDAFGIMTDPASTEGRAGTSTPPNRRPGPLDGATRHPQPPRSPPAELSVGLGPGNGSTCRHPARALDSAIRPPAPRPRLEMSHLPEQCCVATDFALRPDPRAVPAARPIPVQRSTPARKSVSRQATAGHSETDKPATPSALPIPSVQPPIDPYPAHSESLRTHVRY